MFKKENSRLALVGTGLTICCVSDGFIFGQMSGMIDALQSKDSSIPLTDEDISWIASTINVICVLGFALTGTITDIFGRRKALTVINLSAVASWILLYYAYDKTMLIISRFVLGLCFGGALMLVFICIGEYYSPNVRPVCLNLITCVGCAVGTTLGHIFGILLHWRYVALIGIIPSGLSAILPFFWVESPVWLASKGRFSECEKAFRALRPSSEEADSELRLLIAYEKKKQSDLAANTSKALILRNFTIAVREKYFWKIFILGITVCVYKIATGRIFFSTLAITMLEDITNTPDILLFTLVVDGFTIIGAVLSCIIVKRFKIRNILFISGLLANFCLITFGASLYFCSGSNIYMSWLKVILLALYFVIVTAGPCPVLDVILSEIYPLEIKSILMVFMAIIAGILQFSCIKYAMNMINIMGYHGMFFMNSIVIFLCLVYLWFYLPETKGRSLHEIEYYYKNGTFDFNKDIFNFDQTSELLSRRRVSKIV